MILSLVTIVNNILYIPGEEMTWEGNAGFVIKKDYNYSLTIIKPNVS